MRVVRRRVILVRLVLVRGEFLVALAVGGGHVVGVIGHGAGATRGEGAAGDRRTVEGPIVVSGDDSRAVLVGRRDVRALAVADAVTGSGLVQVLALDDGDDVRRAIVVGQRSLEDLAGHRPGLGDRLTGGAGVVELGERESDLAGFVVGHHGTGVDGNGGRDGEGLAGLHGLDRLHGLIGGLRGGQFVGVLRLGRLRVLAGLGDRSGLVGLDLRGVGRLDRLVPELLGGGQLVGVPRLRGLGGLRELRRRGLLDGSLGRNLDLIVVIGDRMSTATRALGLHARDRPRQLGDGNAALFQAAAPPARTLGRAVGVTALLVAARQQLGNGELFLAHLIPFRTGCRRVDAKSRPRAAPTGKSPPARDPMLAYSPPPRGHRRRSGGSDLN